VRLAILSSFYTYAKKLKFLAENPIELLDREKVQEYASAQALDVEDVAIRLQGIDQSTLKGARDYAILSVLLYTGRPLQGKPFGLSFPARTAILATIRANCIRWNTFLSDAYLYLEVPVEITGGQH
jgi:hypothetical protein